MTALLVVLMIVIVVGLDAVLVGLRRRRGVVAERRPAERVSPMHEPHAPPAVFLDAGHSWLRLQPDGTLRVGIDDFLGQALGRVESVSLPPRGTQVARGGHLFALRAPGGGWLRVPAPAAGEVLAHNELVAQSPSTVSSDPYGLGWTLTLRARDPKEAIGPLFIGPGANAHLRHELQRFTDFLTTHPGPGGTPLLADGGFPLRGVLRQLDEAQLAAFEREFLPAGGLTARPGR